jgi:hypothetical protein
VDRDRMTWAYSDLLELHLLALPKNGLDSFPQFLDCQARAKQYLDDLLRVSEPDGWERHSTRRQLLRYIEFFNEKQVALQLCVPLADELRVGIPERDTTAVQPT